MLLRRYFVRRPVVPKPIRHSTGAETPGDFPFHQVHHHRLGPSRGRRSGAPLGMVFALGLSAGILVLLGVALAAGLAPPKSSENLLHTAQPSSKLISTSAQAARVPEPLPPAPSSAPVLEEKGEGPPPPAVVVPIVPEPEPLVSLPTPAPPAESLSVPVLESPSTPPPLMPAAGPDLWQLPLVFSRAHGETPMLRTWNMVRLASALTAAVAVTPVVFAGDKDADAKDIKAILERLDKLEKDLAEKVERAVGANVEKKLYENFETLKKLLEGNLDAQIGKMHEKIKAMTADLDALRKKAGDGVTALYPPDSKTLDEIRGKLDQILARLDGKHVAKLGPQNVGRVLLANLYPEEMLVVINGRPYRVPPNRTVPLDNFPAGSITYELVSPTRGPLSTNNTVVNANETLTLTIR